MSDIKPVIFLDIDGALWTFNTMLPKDEYGYTFDRPCVTALGWLIEHSQASVVLSSSWRIAGLATMCQMWADRDLPGKLISITPDLHSMVNPHFINNPYLLSRGYEIETWLKQNNNPEYLIIDDLPDFTPKQMKHAIIPNSKIGLTLELANQGLAILNR